jgi:hypothetical protein
MPIHLADLLRDLHSGMRSGLPSASIFPAHIAIRRSSIKAETCRWKVLIDSVFFACSRGEETLL